MVVNVIESIRSDGINLNEVKLARALLPSRTETNRPQLETLAEGKPLEKIGDLDAYAHKQKAWPDYVVTEIELVAEAIRSVLQQYAGKKIAFVSDHGITYLAGEAQGLNLGGITADHHGRCAIWDNGSAPSGGDRYMTLNDGKTLCALSHRSLSAKIPKGQGAHGGATPEEVVVPILVVSAKEMAAEFSAQLITTEVSPANPIVRYRIKGEIGLNAPYITYNNKRYALTLAPDGSYTSQRLELTNEARTVTLTVGGVIQEDRIDVRLGVEEDDLFDM